MKRNLRRAGRLAFIMGGLALLSGCVNVDGQLQVGADATLSGQYRVTVDKPALDSAGVDSLDDFREFLQDRKLAGASDAERPGLDVSYAETPQTWIVTGSLDDYPGQFEGLEVARSDGGTILLEWEQEIAEPVNGLPSARYDVQIDLPGPVTSFDDRGSPDVSLVDDTTIEVAADQAFRLTATAEPPADAAGGVTLPGAFAVLAAVLGAVVVGVALRARRDSRTAGREPASGNDPSDTLILPII